MAKEKRVTCNGCGRTHDGTFSGIARHNKTAHHIDALMRATYGPKVQAEGSSPE
jgi:predicted Fe-S protein YdhL (DUF1289 family)